MQLVSVIIPAYKARKFLPETLESIGRQTLQPSEVLVIDDASPEPIDDIIESFADRPGYPPLRLIKHETNRGQAAGRNTGISRAVGDYLAFIDCDDVWAPNHLELAITTIQRENADLAFSPAKIFKERIDEGNPLTECPRTPEEMSLAPIALLQRCFIIMSSVVACKNCIEQLGGFDESENMRAVEDLDLFMRLLKDGARFAMLPESTLFYRKHPESATGRPGYMAFQSAWVRQKHVHSVPGHWFKKRSIVAYYWWQAWLAFLRKGEKRWDILARAVWWSLPVPHQLARGIIRTMRAIR